jgi:hypothetical protein
MSPENIETANPFDVEYPSGRFFVGRERQLTQLRELLKSLSEGSPSNLFIVGKGGSGKTSYLEKIVQESQSKGMLAFKCTLNPGQSAEDNIKTIMRALLRKFEEVSKKVGYENDWIQGKDFRTPQFGLNVEDLAVDFSYICRLMNAEKINACVICIDEGQRISALTLSHLKNSLQSASKCFMVVLSLLNGTDHSDEIEGRLMLDQLAKDIRDPGASRFFQNASSIGAFDSQKEAEDCIKKRLENNKIKFDNKSIYLITKVMGKHPQKMVLLSHKVYELANESSMKEANVELVCKAFSNIPMFKTLIREATEIRDTRPPGWIPVYRELVKAENGATASDIIKKIIPGISGDLLDQQTEPISEALDSLCETKFCRKFEGETYRIPEPEALYALQLVLGVECQV